MLLMVGTNTPEAINMNSSNTPCLYPKETRISELSQSETLLLMTLRLWALPLRNPGKQYTDWRIGLQQSGAGIEACAAMDALTNLFLHYSQRLMDIRCTCNLRLGADEAWFLQMLALIQHNQHWDAQTILTDWVSAAAADMALMCAMHLSESLRRAGIVIPLYVRKPAEVIDLASYRMAGVRHNTTVKEVATLH